MAIVDDDWVFRFPRRVGVEEALGPSFEFISRDPLFAGCRLIRGEPLVDEDADGVHAFLEALHALEPSSLPVQHVDWVDVHGKSGRGERRGIGKRSGMVPEAAYRQRR